MGPGSGWTMSPCHLQPPKNHHVSRIRWPCDSFTHRWTGSNGKSVRREHIQSSTYNALSRACVMPGNVCAYSSTSACPLSCVLTSPYSQMTPTSPQEWQMAHSPYVAANPNPQSPPPPTPSPRMPFAQVPSNRSSAAPSHTSARGASET